MRRGRVGDAGAWPGRRDRCGCGAGMPRRADAGPRRSRLPWRPPSVVRLAALLLPLLAPAPALHAAPLTPISPREAEDLRIRSIRFSYPAERALKSQELRNAMRLQEGQKFHYRYFRGDLAAIVALYQARGYRQAAVTRRQLLRDDGKSVRLEIELDSGVRWHVGGVRIAGGEPLPPDELLAHVRVRPGDPLDYGQVLDDERSLQAFLNQRGYAQASVTNEWIDDPARHVAEVVYHVQPGRRMYVGQVTILGEEQLATRPGLIRRYLTIAPGRLYDPQELTRSRQQLARTDLFRSVFLTTPEISTGDSLQPIEIRVQERRRIRVAANAYLSISGDQVQPRVSGSVQHNNVLGRGNRVGTDLSWGRPLQGVTAYLMDRDVLATGADLIVSAGLTEEWGATMVLANPDDARQFDLLVSNDSVLHYLLLFAGEEVAREYIQTTVYDYTAIKRAYKVSGTLTRHWGEALYGRVAVDYTRARNSPDPDLAIGYTPSDVYGDDGADTGSGDDWSDAVFGPVSVAARASGVAGEPPAGRRAAGDYVDYSDGAIPVDPVWREILTDRSRTVNLTTEFTRDSRDDRIAPSRGSVVRLTGLYAVKLGALPTQVADGEVEARYYQRLSQRLVLALAGHYTQIASLHTDRPLPQVYWKQYGGDGSLRGVDRAVIAAVGGGRIGVNLRTEVRYQAGRIGLVGFLDRARVWRHAGDVKAGDLVRPSGMVDGFGLGLRYVIGLPFRLDVARNDGFDARQLTRVYFSIGQAF